MHRGGGRPKASSAAGRSGFIRSIDTEVLGMVIVDLGGGRKGLGQEIDHSVGLEMLVRLGDHVEAGQPLVRIFAQGNDHESTARRIARRSPSRPSRDRTCP